MITLRAATSEDVRLVFEWANDPDTRANSIATDAIEWPEHERWFAAKLADPDADLFIALSGEKPVGLVRFDWEGSRAEIGVNVAPSHRKKGLAPEMIRTAVEAIAGIREFSLLVANIKPGNEGSVRAFTRAGFAPDGRRVVRGAPVLRYVFRPE